MTSHIQPKASWRKQLDTLLWQNIDLRPREESHARPMSIGLADQLENFISQAIDEAIQEERRRIEEAVKGVLSEAVFIENDIAYRGAHIALREVLSIIHHQE